MVGGNSEAVSKRCEVGDMAKTVGAEVCVGPGSSRRASRKE